MKEPKVCVIGLGGQSAFLSVDHFPAPGETVSACGLFFELGGKGYNQAVACARMGVKTVFIGAVGDDANGQACRTALEAEGIETCLIRKDVPTAFACITTDRSGENTVEVYPGAAKELSAQDLRSRDVMEKIRQCDWLLLQNELSHDCLREACAIGAELGLQVVINPAPAGNLTMRELQNAFLITPNLGEAKQLARLAIEQNIEPVAVGQLLRAGGIDRAVITLGADGVLVMDHHTMTMVPSYRCGPAVDTTGAGDTFNGVLISMLARGADLLTAARTGAVASGIGVTRQGAVAGIPREDEVMSAYKRIYTDPASWEAFA